jgi:hypothetical protein
MGNLTQQAGFVGSVRSSKAKIPFLDDRMQ